MAYDMNHSLGIAIAFSIITSIALTALFETITQLEDPFVNYNNKDSSTSDGISGNLKSQMAMTTSLDGIDVTKELQIEFVHSLLDWRQHCLPNAKPFVFNASHLLAKKTTE